MSDPVRGAFEMSPRAAEAVHEWLSEEREALLERLASSISHALGTPLQVIQGRAGLIAADTGDDEIRRSARVIETKVGDLTETIQQILGFAREALGPAEPVSVQDVVEESVTRHRPLAESRGVALSVEAIDPSLRALMPRDRFRQMIDGGISQGLAEVPPEGEIVVSARVSDARPPAGYPNRPYCAVTVSWRGVAFDEARFADFQEPWRATTGVDRRTALRLVVVHGLARRLGGWVDLGGGREATDFTLCVPAASKNGE